MNSADPDPTLVSPGAILFAYRNAIKNERKKNMRKKPSKFDSGLIQIIRIEKFMHQVHMFCSVLQEGMDWVEILYCFARYVAASSLI